MHIEVLITRCLGKILYVENRNKDVYLCLINIIICLMSVLPLCFDFHIHSKCNVFIESLINHIPNQNDIETENCTNTNVAKNDY